eukprot:SAG31_NODE_294_length_18242_cov_28.418949_2_plen_114_part_00
MSRLVCINPPSFGVQANGRLSFSGHPDHLHFDGVYTLEKIHKGGPVLKNASGCYCYRIRDWWIIAGDDESLDDEFYLNGWIEARDGHLPIGPNMWECSIGDSWSKCILTVALL